MSRVAFREIALNDRKLDAVKRANQVIKQYRAAGLTLTLRQLYYQFVSRNWITNEEKSYKWLGTVISDGRLAGHIDWDAIEDRGRVPEVPLQFQNLKHRVDSALHNYRLHRWEGQDVYAELWVEKQALAGVLQPLAREFHVTLMVNKGYSSQSAMYESAQRFISEGRAGHLFYLGDHDPSGEDMVRDITDRMRMFGVENLEVTKLALTWSQIEKFDPPPNPAKITDSRAKKYIEKFGRESWEVDALPPEELARLIRRALQEIIDQEVMDEVIQREEADKRRLSALVESITDGAA